MGPVITTEAGARRLGAGARGLAPCGTTVLEADGRPRIEVTATPYRHGPPGSNPIVGQVIGFSLQWQGQLGSLWLSGDTVLFAGLRDVARRIQVSTAVLNLGGVTFPWLSGPLRYTLNADEAIELCREINPRTIVPPQFEGWKHFREPRDTRNPQVRRLARRRPDPLAGARGHDRNRSLSHVAGAEQELAPPRHRANRISTADADRATTSGVELRRLAAPTLLLRNASRSDAGDRRRRGSPGDAGLVALRGRLRRGRELEIRARALVSFRRRTPPWSRGAPALRGKEACRNPQHRTSHGSVPSGAARCAVSARCETDRAGGKMPVPPRMQGWPVGCADRSRGCCSTPEADSAKS